MKDLPISLTHWAFLEGPKGLSVDIPFGVTKNLGKYFGDKTVILDSKMVAVTAAKLTLPPVFVNGLELSVMHFHISNLLCFSLHVVNVYRNWNLF